jgi:hypothetical protein
MNCVMFEEKISQYVDGALDWSDACLVEQHLRTCAACAAFADRLEYDRILLQTLPPECSEIDFACLRAEIRGRIASEHRGAKRLPVLAAAASFLLAAGIGAIWLRPGRAPIHPPQTANVKVEQNGTDGADGRLGGHAKSLDTNVETADKNVRATSIPRADPALEAALQEFLAAEEVPPPPAVAPASPVAIHIVTGDPNVVLILLQENGGVSNE